MGKSRDAMRLEGGSSKRALGRPVDEALCKAPPVASGRRTARQVPLGDGWQSLAVGL